MRKALLLLVCLIFVTPRIHSAESAKPPIIITAPAKMEPRGEWVFLIISDSKHTYELAWSRLPEFKGDVLLEPNRIYTFTIVEDPFTRNVFLPRVTKVEQDGKTIYDREMCEVHHVKMDHKKVPIIYGLIRPRPGAPSADTERRLFPHRREICFGGCVVDSESPKTRKIFVCDQCKKEYAKWEAGNPSTP